MQNARLNEAQAGIKIPGRNTPLSCVRAQSLQSCLTLCEPVDEGKRGE